MRRCWRLLFALVLFPGVLAFGFPAIAWADRPIAIAVHGGAGALTGKRLTAGHQKRCRAKLAEALKAGHAVLSRGGSAQEAVVAAVVVLEDSPLFNAGKGAVFTAEGKNELDAALMAGKTRSAGAVGGVRRIKNPIRLAQAVLKRSPHVLLFGRGAEAFARSVGIPLVSPRYFHTKERWQQLRRIKQKVRKARGRAASLQPGRSQPGRSAQLWSTVGAVALDRHGNLAAGTSTGGLSNKAWGRIGDSPIVGAGTYADNRACAVSATGQGEYFIRGAIAHEIAARLRFTKDGLGRAAKASIHGELSQLGGKGGVIAIDAKGAVVMAFNTASMYRGSIDTKGTLFTAVGLP